MIKELENFTNDSSDGGFGRYEDAGPSNVPGRDAGDDDSDNSDDEQDPEEVPKEESDEDKTQEKGVIHEGQIELES